MTQNFRESVGGPVVRSTISGKFRVRVLGLEFFSNFPTTENFGGNNREIMQCPYQNVTMSASCYTTD
jgi:hypothetical protein